MRRTLAEHLAALDGAPVAVHIGGDHTPDGRLTAASLAVTVRSGGVVVLDLDAAALLFADGAPVVGPVDPARLMPAGSPDARHLDDEQAHDEPGEQPADDEPAASTGPAAVL